MPSPRCSAALTSTPSATASSGSSARSRRCSSARCTTSTSTPACCCNRAPLDRCSNRPRLLRNPPLACSVPRARTSDNPRASSADSAFDHSESPAPTSVSSGARSTTSTRQPTRRSATAHARPPIPAPTTTARRSPVRAVRSLTLRPRRATHQPGAPVWKFSSQHRTASTPRPGLLLPDRSECSCRHPARQPAAPARPDAWSRGSAS